MCVTERWLYRECGCHYNHSVLCSTYRRTREPVDQWHGETDIETNVAAAKQMRRRARPAEPQECPQHSTVEKYFLNQICEDCLLAELHPKPPGSEQPTSPASQLPTPQSGEGLIWDSEVKVEIQSEGSEPPPRPKTPDVASLRHCSREDGQRIVESHIEVKIEVETYSVSAGDPSSPLSLTADDEASSPSSSPPTSPTSPAVPTEDHDHVAPPYQNKRYGLAFHSPIVADLDDADDECSSSPERYYRFPTPPSRGSSPALGRVNGADRSTSSPLPVSHSKPNSNAPARLNTLRSFSNNRVPPSETTGEDKSSNNKSTSSLALSTTSTKPKSRNPFRKFRTRKVSPLVAETIETQPVLLVGDYNDHNNISIVRQKTTADSPIPPRGSSLKSWAFFKLQGRKHSERRVSRSHSRLRSLAPSPTGSWSRNQHGHNDRMYSQLSDSSSEIDARTSTQEDERPVERIEEQICMPITMTPIRPKPSNVPGWPVILDGYRGVDLDLDAMGGNEEHPEITLADECGYYHHGPAPAWPVYPRLQQSELDRPESWPLRSAPNTEEEKNHLPPLHALAQHPPDKYVAEEAVPTKLPVAERGVQLQRDNVFTPLLRPDEGPADTQRKRPGFFPPRQSSLRTRIELRRTSRPLSECEVPVPALISAS